MSVLDPRSTAVLLQVTQFDQTRATQSLTIAQELAGFERRRAKVWTEDVVAEHDRAIERDLDDRAAAYARRDSAELLATLSDAGIAWRDIARLMQVSVPAVQKWRRGQPIAPGNRLRLAQLVAVLDRLAEAPVHDPASWLETPVKDDVQVSPLDLLAANKDRLVVLFAEDHCSVGDLLDEFDPDWRAARVDASFETFLDEDGHRSIRPRS